MQAACINPLPELPPAERILVIRLGALGDVVRTLPALAELRVRYADAHVAWLVEASAESAVRHQPELDEVIVFPREALVAHWRARRPAALVREALRFLGNLRRKRFDLVLDFHGILKSGALSLGSGAPVRVGFAAPLGREGSARFANRRVRVAPLHLSRFERNAALIDFLGAAPATLPKAAAGEGAGWSVEPDRRARLRAALGRGAHGEGPGAASGFALIHPGSSARASYKRYPASSWGAVARGLADQGLGCRVAFGNDAERELASQVVAASGGAASLAPSTGDLRDLAALACESRVFLAGDTGPLHVASLVGTPVVQLLGPTDPVENRPWPGAPYRSVRVPVGCSPCRRGCPAASCMTVLPPQRVVDAARELLDASRLQRRPA